jgi:GT2 family glycosyltransferase
MMHALRLPGERETATAPRLSIIIVTYNSRDQIDGCLSSLSSNPPSMDAEVVIVDNASGDGTAAAVRQMWPDVSVIETGENLGFAAGCNAGIRVTSGEFVLLLNPDARVTAGALDALTAHLKARPDAAVAGPRIVDEDGRAEVSCGAMIGPVAELRQKLLVSGNARVPMVRAYVDRLTRESRDVDWVSGACLLVRREDAEAVGLLDERYFMYAEDVDFCAAIRARRRRVLFTADAEVVHLRGRSVASAARATEAAYRRSQLAFYKKHRPGWLPILRAYLTLRRRLPDRQTDMQHDQGRPSP